MVGSHAERILAAKLREGLWQAVLESDEISGDEIDSIRFQKLLLKAIEEFSLEDRVTVEWYLDGKIVSQNAADRDRVGSKTEFESAHQYHLEEYPTVDQIAEFYQGRLKELLIDSNESSTFQFLRAYYTNHGNVPYRELYLRNLDIGQVLSEVYDDVERDSEVSEQHMVKFKKTCRHMKSELLLHSEFGQIPPYVDVFERGGSSLLMQLSDDNVQKEATMEILSEYNNFYYYGLWNIVARLISYHNHEGPSGKDVEQVQTQKLQKADERFINRYEGLAEWMKQNNIKLPNIRTQLPAISLSNELVASEDEDGEETTANLKYEMIGLEANLDEDPEEIDLDELMEQDDPSEPLSDLVLEERARS